MFIDWIQSLITSRPLPLDSYYVKDLQEVFCSRSPPAHRVVDSTLGRGELLGAGMLMASRDGVGCTVVGGEQKTCLGA